MKKNFRLLAIFVAVVLISFYAVARPAGEDTAKDPVCKMDVKIAGATHTAEYLGKTYYFCSEDCKTAFLKEPAKFAPKEGAETSAQGVATPECTRTKDAPKPCCAKMGHEGEGMRMKKMHGMPMKPGMMGHGMAGGCPMCGGMAGKADIAIENTPDGAVVKITSKDPEAVKKIQEHLAAMKAACKPATSPEAKKAEEKKEK